MANTLTFDQISTVLNDIVKQATGVETMKATDTSSFVAQAQTALLVGNDRIMNSISQVLDRTIFSVRPYNAKFKGLRRTTQQWGNHVRKLGMLDDDWENDQRQPLDDDTAVDMYKIKKVKFYRPISTAVRYSRDTGLISEISWIRRFVILTSSVSLFPCILRTRWI